MEQYLRFSLPDDVTALLPVRQVVEVLNLNQLLPIPAMPAWVLGVFNWRGEIIWAIDLAQGLGLTPLAVRTPYLAILAHHQGQRLGLVVDQVEDMAWCGSEAIKPLIPGLFPAALTQAARGHWLPPDQQQALVLLDGEKLLNPDFWQLSTPTGA